MIIIYEWDGESLDKGLQYVSKRLARLLTLMMEVLCVNAIESEHDQCQHGLKHEKDHVARA